LIPDAEVVVPANRRGKVAAGGDGHVDVAGSGFAPAAMEDDQVILAVVICVAGFAQVVAGANPIQPLAGCREISAARESDPYVAAIRFRTCIPVEHGHIITVVAVKISDETLLTALAQLLVSPTAECIGRGCACIPRCSWSNCRKPSRVACFGIRVAT